MTRICTIGHEFYHHSPWNIRHSLHFAGGPTPHLEGSIIAHTVKSRVEARVTIQKSSLWGATS